MRFLIDRCAGRRLADRLRDNGHDVLEAQALGPDPGDRFLLELAASEDRILITMDKDFGELIYLHRARHAGVIRLPDVRADERIQLVDQALQRCGEALEERAIVTIRGNRIRTSRTPNS